MAISDETLPSVLAELEQCRAVLEDNGSLETAQLLSVAILQLRMKLNGIGDVELRALCEEILRKDRGADRSRALRSPSPEQRRPVLKLVK